LQIKSLMIWYLGIAKWARSDQVPSFEDYMEIGTPSSALDDFASYGFIAMDDCDQKKLKEWFYSKPKIFHALNALFRIRNDIVTFEVRTQVLIIIFFPRYYWKISNVSSTINSKR